MLILSDATHLTFQLLLNGSGSILQDGIIAFQCELRFMDVNMVGTTHPYLQLFLLKYILAHWFTYFMYFSESDVLSFNGSSIVRWDLMREPVSAIKESIRFRFKTNQANGVLLYSRGTQNDYIAMEMKENRMCLNINLGMDGSGQSCSRILKSK